MHLKLRPFFRDVSLTFVSQFLILFVFFYSYNLIANYFGSQGMGEYSLAKRVIGLFQPILLLGLGMGMTRYIALAKDSKQRSNYIRVGASIIALSVSLCFVLMNVADGYFAKIFLGSYSYSGLVRPISFLVAGLTAHAVVSSCLRGSQFARAFNLLDIVNLALLPVIILLFVKNLTVAGLMSVIGISTFVIALLFGSFFVRDLFTDRSSWEFVKPLRELFVYSSPRFLNGFVYAAFFSLGPIFATHFMPIRDVGYLSVSQSLLGTIGALVAPLGIILLPKIASLISQKRDAEIQENLNHLISATIYCSLFVLTQMLIFTDTIINYWLGPQFIDSVVAMRIILVSIPFYLFCGTAGNVLEAAKVEPVNLINLSISFVISVTVLFLFLFIIKSVSPIVVFSGAFTLGLISFGFLSYSSIRAIYPDESGSDLNSIWTAIGINSFFAVVAFFAKPVISANFYYLIVFECLLSGLFGMALWRMNTVWIRVIPGKVMVTQ